jgi:hypothetical protein
MEATHQHQQPVIPEFIGAATEPPPWFVPFGPSTGGNGGNGNGHINGYPRPHSPIYAGIPLNTPSTPRQIYATSPTATPPAVIPPMPFAGAGPGVGLGLGAPVVPSPPRDRHVSLGFGTPHHRSVPLSGSSGSATPVSRMRDLPGVFPQDVRGILRRVPSDGSTSSHGSSYPKFGSTTYVDPPFYPPEGEEEEEEEEEEYEDEATRRNTLANANVGADVLPIPPPSFQWKRR